MVVTLAPGLYITELGEGVAYVSAGYKASLVLGGDVGEAGGKPVGEKLCEYLVVGIEEGNGAVVGEVFVVTLFINEGRDRVVETGGGVLSWKTACISSLM